LWVSFFGLFFFLKLLSSRPCTKIRLGYHCAVYSKPWFPLTFIQPLIFLLSMAPTLSTPFFTYLLGGADWVFFFRTYCQVYDESSPWCLCLHFYRLTPPPPPPPPPAPAPDLALFPPGPAGSPEKTPLPSFFLLQSKVGMSLVLIFFVSRSDCDHLAPAPTLVLGVRSPS